ncbi:MAG: pilus assembly protein N-terminal domain-containing protein [candidate division Zixibacteria bacterium]|nr:pilus assembly protein N-terminal domain-containing protein [candidate division Zixibacteria bacterium]
MRIDQESVKTPHDRTGGACPVFGIFNFVVLLVGVLLVCPNAVRAQNPTEDFHVTEGHSRVLRHPEKIKTVSVANNEIADVVAITSDELVVIGKKAGNTTLIVFGETTPYVMHNIIVDRNFSGQQIMLEVQIGEVNRNTMKELGFDFTWVNRNDNFVTQGEKTVGSFGGQTQAPKVPVLPNAGLSGYFKFVGDFNTISAAVRALEQRGDFKLLASPKLLCLSGNEASFLAGGEIPVPASVTNAGGVTQLAIQWKEYGVRLKFVPTIVDSTLINLKVNPEVSSLDFNNSIVLSGFSIPALLTRRASATVELFSGQGLLLGGLVLNEQVKSVQRIPILGHIPLLGALFTRHVGSTAENELLILVSPRLYSAGREEIPALPWNGRDGKSDTNGSAPGSE